MMKKHLSVLGLWARIYGWQILCVLALMAVFETALFGWRLFHPEAAPPAAEEVVKGMPLIAGVAALTALSLLSRGSDESAAVGYTLQRLSIREEAAVLWKAAFNLLCLLGLWAAQAAVALALCLWYAASLPPEYRSGQTVFLAFYRVNFLHNLLPLDDWTCCLRNGALLAALAFASAMRTYKLRRGSRFGWGFCIFLDGVLWAAFTTEAASWGMNIFVSLAALCAMAVDAGYLNPEREGSAE